MPVIHYRPIQSGCSVVVHCCAVQGRFTLCFLIFLVRFGLRSSHLLGNSFLVD